MKGYNDILIAKELNISTEEAKKIVKNNYNNYMKEIDFIPYIPEE